MGKNLIAKINSKINASVDKVWEALINPAIVEKYMLGAKQKSDLTVNSPITWDKMMNENRFTDRGTILEISENKLISYSHYSPLSGKTDIPENYAVVRIKLTTDQESTLLSLESSNNDDIYEKLETEKIWQYYMLGLKIICEM